MKKKSFKKLSLKRAIVSNFNDETIKGGWTGLSPCYTIYERGDCTIPDTVESYSCYDCERV